MADAPQIPLAPPSKRVSPLIGTTNFAVNSISSVGDASQVTLLLSDWKNFGLSERVSYHLDLIEAIKSRNHHEAEGEPMPRAPDNVSGVASLLECVPSLPLKDLTKLQRKTLRSRIRDFNLFADQVRENGSSPFHRPAQLPVRISPATRVSFTYEMTRMVLVVDASPTLVSAFGASDADEHFCAMDRLPGMAKTFFEALTNPITGLSLAEGVNWTPSLAITVLAVYPHGGKTEENNSSILVRDFRMQSVDDARLLVGKIRDWIVSDVEGVIATRLNSGGVGLAGYDCWTIPKYTSSLRDLLDAGDVALDFLPSKARPCLVIATDCRAIACEEILELFDYEERMDVPIHVLDLSSPTSHFPIGNTGRAIGTMDSASLVSDPGGPTTFPLHMQDDSERLFDITRATTGCFIDSQLLQLASTTLVGQVPIGSPLAFDQYLVLRRRAVRPNALQWYILFEMSPLSPTTMPSALKASPQMLYHPAGRLAPPQYLRIRMGYPGSVGKVDTMNYAMDDSSSVMSFAGKSNFRLHTERTSELRRPPHRTTFSTYVVAPVRIKGLLLTRIKEGYRAKQYGTSTHDRDKISIQLTLPLEDGTVIHYELQYKALAGRNPLVGAAHVKVELSAFNYLFVQKIKNEFLAYTTGASASTSTTRLCKILWWIRREDLLQSFLCPVEWGDKLSSPTSPFVRRLSALSRLQLMRNYRIDRFDVVCTGRMPYDHDDDLPWRDFVNTDNGEQELFTTLSEWSTQTIDEKKKYVKLIPTSDGLTSYCVIEVRQSSLASRLFTISVNSISGGGIQNRIMAIAGLKDALGSLRDIAVLPKLMYASLVGVSHPFQDASHLVWRSHFMENHYEHEEWALVKDPELLELLMRRRNEIGDFFLLHSTESYALFAKDISVTTGKTTDSPREDVYLVEYQVQLKGIKKEPVVNMHVEKEVGIFSTDTNNGIGDILTRAHRMFVRVKRRDQECSVALRSRTQLLGLFSNDASALSSNELLINVERLLGYASQQSRNLRFFQNFAAANKELERLTVDLMLSNKLTRDIVKLEISILSNVGNQDPGHWFFIRFDRNTLCFVHLPLAEKVSESEGAKFSCRELSFFTFAIGDLYCVRDENNADDDESTQGHISEHMAVEKFADDLEAAHKENYSQAAYQALRSLERQPEDEFSVEDFSCVLESCDFAKVAEVFVSRESTPVDYDSFGESKLMKTIRGLFSPIPGMDGLMFFNSEETGLDPILYKEEMEIAEYDGHDSFDDELSSDDSDVVGTVVPHHLENEQLPVSSAPLFIRFSIDGRDVLPRELSRIEKDVNLSVYMSIFNQPEKSRQKMELPEVHRSVATEVESALKSYIAEQTLERLREAGRSIEEVDLGLVRKCLRKARNVILSVFDVHFYISKSDRMVPAATQSSNESEIEAGFNLLFEELKNTTEYDLCLTSHDSFCVQEANNENQAFKYWAFITVQKSLGLVTVEVYAPEGLTRASSIVSSLQEFVARICRRTNQLRLLQSLHRSRTASAYLIRDSDNIVQDDAFPGGHFSCPVVFTESYELYNRCSAAKTILELNSTVLHSLSVSNRPGVFVYKDEAMGIFYLSLEGIKSTDEGSERVKLLVFGVQEPGPSVTVQLKHLLKKKILQRGVDVFSSVLTKNPHISWKATDLAFLRNFESLLADAEDTSVLPDLGKHEHWFELPASVIDPLTVLIYFRQNLCGSTFFKRLNEASASDSGDMVDESKLALDSVESGAEIIFDPKEFIFFYNNAPSPLDQSLQAVSTLTWKGKKYCEMAGNGIAIIEVSLVREDGLNASSATPGAFVVGIPPGMQQAQLSISPDLLWAREIEDPVLNSTFTATVNQREQDLKEKGRRQDRRKQRLFIRLRLTDTGLNRSALKDWLLLTLNQVIVASEIENHIQRASTGLLSSQLLLLPSQARSDSPDSLQDRRLRVLHELNPGFPLLLSMLESSVSLPHPAVKAVEFNTVIKSSSVASYTIMLLESCIVKNLSGGKNDQTTRLMNRMIVIRSSRGERPEIAKLVAKAKQTNSSTAHAFSKGSSEALGDSPIDCPEYVCYFCWERYSAAKEDELDEPLPMIFPEVKIGDATSDKRPSLFAQRLLRMKKRMPSAFQRSFAFVLIVKRNRRSLTMYNWDPKLVSTVLSEVKKLEAANVSEIGMTLRANQRRCLGKLAPLVQRTSSGLNGPQNMPKVEPVEKAENLAPAVKSEHQRPLGGPTRRIQRPTAIRRPKLVGKSVEGGAMQAINASREKARVQTKTGTRTQLNRSAPQKKSDLNKKSAKSVQIPPEDEAEVDRFRQKFGQAMGSSWECAFALTKTSYQILQEFWFRKEQHQVRGSTRDNVLLQTRPLWNDCGELSSWVRLLSKDLPQDFAKHMEAVMRAVGACRILSPSTSSTTSTDSGKVVFFMTALRTKPPMTTFLVFRLGYKKLLGKGRKSTMNCDVWMMKLLPAGGEKPSKKRRTTKSIEKRSAALGCKIGITDMLITQIDAQIFDFSSAIVEQAARRDGDNTLDEEYLHLTEQLIQRYTVDEQQELPKLKYRAFDANIILKSYEDKFIDKFDSFALFDHMYEKDKVIKCGEDAILFRQTIQLHDTTTCCFLKRDRTDSKKMRLIYLCSTFGRNIDEYVFPEECNVAATIFKLIVIEGARLALHRLRDSAIEMHRDSLWQFATTIHSNRESGKIDELLSMLSGHSVFGDDLMALLGDENLAIIPQDLFTKMSRDTAFSPSRKIRIERDGYQQYFFNAKLDSLILFKVHNGKIFDIVLLSRVDITNETMKTFVDIFTNYLLFYLWKT